MVTLKNSELEVELNAKGAEIIKIIGQHDHINYMWRRDPALWASSAPILFPIIGALHNDECLIDGKTYHMTQHGFSRHNEYMTHQLSDTCVEFELTPNEDILKQYPYLFDLKVIYTLKENTLECRCIVKNTDDKTIYFQIGGHPAFACPFMEHESSNDYYVEFEKEETLDQKVIDVAHRAMSRITKPFFDHERRFFVRQAILDNDAIVLKDFQSSYVALKTIHHQKAIYFHMENYPHLGIWASKHVGGLLALEPWNGHGDYIDFHGEFKDKEGMIALEPQQEFTCMFAIEIRQ